MPAKGCASPQIRFCMAMAKPKTSRPQPWASEIGAVNRPAVERTPKAISAIRQPETMMVSGA
jgi:hypothetical protein